MKRPIIISLCLLFTPPALAKVDHPPGKAKSLPPGLQKKIDRGGELPPGWQKKLVRGEVLDPALYRRAIRITPPGGNGYPSPRAGTELLRLEDRIIRVKNDTREILEIFGVEVDW